MVEKLTDVYLEQCVRGYYPKHTDAQKMACELLERRRATPADDLRAAAELMVMMAEMHEWDNVTHGPQVALRRLRAALAQKGDA